MPEQNKYDRLGFLRNAGIALARSHNRAFGCFLTPGLHVLCAFGKSLPRVIARGNTESANSEGVGQVLDQPGRRDHDCENNEWQRARV